MKKIFKKLTSVVLVLTMLFSFSIFVFAKTDSNVYTNIESEYLKYTLQEYVKSGKKSEVFFSEECILSTGERGYCNIGYNADAHSFYILCFTASNTSYRWCYKFDLSYTWKHRTSYLSDVSSWQTVDSFTIQFIGHNSNPGKILDIDNLDPRCRLLFKDIGSSTYVNVETKYLKYALQNYVNSGKGSEVFYSGECILSTGERGYCEIGYHEDAKSFYILCRNQSSTYHRWCYKYDLDYVWKHRTEYISDVEKWEFSEGFAIQFLGNGSNLNFENLDSRCRLLFKDVDSPICINIESEYLEYALQDYVDSNHESITFYTGNCILSTGESGYCEIGYHKEAKSFYILCRNQSSIYHRWCYKYDLDYIWKHRTEYISDTEEWDIPDGFTIQFLSDSGTTSKNLDCPSKLSFMFYTGDYVSDDILFDKLLIYQTRNKERLGFAEPDNIYDVTPITAEDLTYGEKSTTSLISNGSLISMSDLYENGNPISVSKRVTIIKNFFNSQISYDPTFSSILSEMVDHFVDGSGEDYSNADLTNAVMNHPNTQHYVNCFIDILNQQISLANGNVESLYYDEQLWIQPTQRENHVLVKAMRADMKNLHLPSYGYDNGVPGLTLAIDGWYGNKIEIESFEKSNGNYSGTLRFTFYDHFGLDTPDLSESKYGGLKAGLIPGFKQWYILQHWDELGATVQPKPFVTVVSYTVPFSGTY